MQRYGRATKDVQPMILDTLQLKPNELGAYHSMLTHSRSVPTPRRWLIRI